MLKWSFSGLKQFVNCPKQFYEVKVACNFEQKVSAQMQYGTEVHKALEDYARERKPLPTHYKKFKSLVDVLLEIPGEKFIEYKMALTKDKEPCAFYSSDYWVRGITDIMIVDNDYAFVIDYKTGSNKYPDPKQLKLMALMTFAHFPNVQTVKAGLLFVAHNSFLPDDYLRKKQDEYWKDFTPDLMRMELAHKTNHWQPNPSPLCRWCPVTTCDFHKE
jgi:CRISPR/Cas system-associated exonuclease Cas4 (RecB family)